jgi:hypothetical protein
MSTRNNLEKRMSTTINEVSFIDRVIGQLFKKRLKKVWKNVEKKLDDHPDLEASVADYLATQKKLERDFSTFCKKNPDSFLCQRNNPTGKMIKGRY